jgi:hypothetical protein
MAKKEINADVVHYGTEPSWNIIFKDDLDRDCAIARAFSWYNYMASDNELKKWTMEYMKSIGYTKEQLQKISGIDITIKYGEIPGITGFNVGMISRMLFLGAPLQEAEKVNLKTCITYLLTKAEKEKVIEEKPEEVAPTIQDRTNEKIRNVIGDLEQMGDSILQKSNKVKDLTITNSLEKLVKKADKKQEVKLTSVKDILHNKSIKSNQCERISSWFESVLSQTETDLKEDPTCYSSYSSLKEYKLFLKEIITSCKEYGEANKTIRIVKKKRKSPAELCKKVKYKQEETKLKVKSVHPSKIIGAEKVLIYNVCNGRATLLQARTTHGLSIKGSSIIDYDTSINTSYAKKIRKPEEFVKEINGKGIRVVKNSLDSIKTKVSEASGRINEDTIILGVY